MKNSLILLVVIVCLFACQSKPINETDTKKVNATADTEETQYQDGSSSATYTEDDHENIISLIRLTLNEEFKKDLEQGWLDSLSRQFKYDQYDINGDGKKEIFVGLTGPYFCGSGGCTMFLLTHHGDVLTKFTVVEYPLYISPEVIDGWNDLVMYSGGAYRRATYNGQTYPHNPSILEEYAGDVGILPKLLEWQELEFSKF